MYLWIAPLKKSKYRGVDRIISASDFYNVNQKNLKVMFEMYLQYIDFDSNYDSSGDVSKYVDGILPFYMNLKQNNVQCEILVCDSNYISKFNGYKLKFLGIDIANDFFESLIVDNLKYSTFIDNNLINYNKNFLFSNKDIANIFINICKNNNKKQFVSYTKDMKNLSNLMHYVYKILL